MPIHGERAREPVGFYPGLHPVYRGDEPVLRRVHPDLDTVPSARGHAGSGAVLGVTGQVSGATDLRVAATRREPYAHQRRIVPEAKELARLGVRGNHELDGGM